MNLRLVGTSFLSIATVGCFGGGALTPPAGTGGQGETAGQGETGGAGGAAGAAGVAADAGRLVPPGTGIELITNSDGWLEPNPASAVGSWWSANDYFGADGTPGGGDCPTAGFPMSACSTLTTPVPFTPFRPDPGGSGMCASGRSAQVLTGSDGTPAYSVIWGNIIGFNVATADPNPMPVLGTYDAPAHGITGFAFDIDAVPDGGHLRVLFGTPGTENHPAYWFGASNDMSPILAPGHYEMRWPEIGGPLWYASPPPFDPTKIEWIAFQIVSDAAAPVPFGFCIGKVVLLTN